MERRPWAYYGVDISEIEANDWYSNSQAPNSSGENERVGKVYYLDCMAEGDLPATWKDDYEPAQSLRAIPNAGNEDAIKELLKKYNAIGPFDHNLTVTWSVDDKTTKVKSKVP